jgi:hypothetical protein
MSFGQPETVAPTGKPLILEQGISKKRDGDEVN